MTEIVIFRLCNYFSQDSNCSKYPEQNKDVKATKDANQRCLRLELIFYVSFKQQ